MAPTSTKSQVFDLNLVPKERNDTPRNSNLFFKLQLSLLDLNDIQAKMDPSAQFLTILDIIREGERGFCVMQDLVVLIFVMCYLYFLIWVKLVPHTALPTTL